MSAGYLHTEFHAPGIERQARDSATDGPAHQLGADAAQLAALRSDLANLFTRLCSLASAGASTVASAADTPDTRQRGDLMIAAEALFGMVGYVGEMGARACGDPGYRGDPSTWLTWLALGDGIEALHGLSAMTDRARIDAAAAAVAAGSASTGGAA